MLNQKDNDFDDLFRRASDKYPLRTDSADWDRMAAALDDPSSSLPPETQDTDKRRKRRFIWFFLLLPLGGAGYFIFHQTGAGHGHAVATESVVKAPASGADVNSAGETVRPGAGSGEKSVDGSVAGGAGKGAVDAGSAGVVSKGTDRAAASAGGAGRGSNGAVKARGKTRVSAAVPATGGSDIVRSGGSDVVRPGGMFGGRESGMVGASKNGEVGGTAASRVADYPVDRAHISKDFNLTVSVVAPVAAKDSSKVKPKASSKQKSSYLYAGLLAAPDLSSVKFQSTKGVGTTYSLLLGYQFNKRWAVETGVSLDRKRYYTDAEYFDTKSVNVPQYGKLKNVDGTCYMWEVPLNIRYNFSQTKSTKWFATAGLSTYFMTRENYNYHYTKNYGTVDTSSNWNIKKPSQYWFSIINLSAGYEHRLGGIGNLRIEPYLRIPLSGLGTGKLNILSTGINIGITRRLW